MSSDINNRYIWFNDKIMPLAEATINILSPTSQYGINVFEGMRCYWNDNKNQLYAFRLHDHYLRLKNSIKLMKFEDKYSIEYMEKAFIDVIKKNNYKEDISIRQTVFLDGFGSWSSTKPISMFIAPIPKGRTYADKIGIKCCISSWERISDKNISPRIKAGSNYINSRMAQLEAIENGYDTAIFMNYQGKVAESPGSCIFIVKDNTLITPPITASILESITRSTIIELVKKELDIPVVERNIDRSELYISDEVFLCGSAMEITPVVNIDGYIINNSSIGPFTKAIKEVYFNVVRGNMSVYFNWLTSVYD